MKSYIVIFNDTTYQKEIERKHYKSQKSIQLYLEKICYNYDVQIYKEYIISDNYKIYYLKPNNGATWRLNLTIQSTEV